MMAFSSRQGGWTAAASAGPGIVDVAPLLANGLGGGAAATALVCGVVLLGRRLAVPAGVFGGGSTALAVAAAGAALVLLADLTVRLGGGRAASLAARAGLVLGLAAVALPPRAATWLEGVSMAIALSIAGAAVAFAPGPASRDRRPPERPSLSRRRPARRPEPQPGRLRQRFTRYEDDGADRLRGRIVIAVHAGAKTAQGHVGFCPAFAATPAVAISTEYDGVEATVAAAEVLPWGVRVEVRLAEPAEEPLEIPVDLFVRAID